MNGQMQSLLEIYGGAPGGSSLLRRTCASAPCTHTREPCLPSHTYNQYNPIATRRYMPVSLVAKWHTRGKRLVIVRTDFPYKCQRSGWPLLSKGIHCCSSGCLQSTSNCQTALPNSKTTDLSPKGFLRAQPCELNIIHYSYMLILFVKSSIAYPGVDHETDICKGCVIHEST